MAEAPEFVTLQVEDGVGIIRLDRPKMNAINEQLHLEVKAAAMEAGRREDGRTVILYGGERGFAAGADIQQKAGLGPGGRIGGGGGATESFPRAAPLPHPG